jgi:hypothetical protein
MSKTTFLPNLDQSESISLKTAAISFAVIVGVIGLVLAGAISANRHRQSSVINQYTQETTQLIETHQAAAKQLFTQTFDDCQKALVAEQQRAWPVNQNISTISCSAATAQLAQLGVNQLQDPSAIAYLRLKDSGYELLQASGSYAQSSSLTDYGQLSYRDEVRADLAKYFQKHQPILMWQDFVPYIDGKEVLVPVVIDGQTIGYIFRGVIER